MDERLAAIHDMIDALGVTTEYCDLPKGMDGEYLHDEKVIKIQQGLLGRRHRSTLAHECCHAVFEDVPTSFGPVYAKRERRADEWAAMRLFSLEEYRAAEYRHDGHIEGMAISLNVTVELVEAARALLLRVGDTVYFEPRFGAGQFQHRLTIA